MTAFAMVRTTLYVCGFFALWAWLAVLARAFDPALALALPAWARSLGLVIAVPGALLLAAGFFLITHTFVVLYEERTLRRRFGASYERYLASVGRWLPRPLNGGPPPA